MDPLTIVLLTSPLSLFLIFLFFSYTTDFLETLIARFYSNRIFELYQLPDDIAPYFALPYETKVFKVTDKIFNKTLMVALRYSISNYQINLRQIFLLIKRANQVDITNLEEMQHLYDKKIIAKFMYNILRFMLIRKFDDIQTSINAEQTKKELARISTTSELANMVPVKANSGSLSVHNNAQTGTLALAETKA